MTLRKNKPSRLSRAKSRGDPACGRAVVVTVEFTGHHLPFTEEGRRYCYCPFAGWSRTHPIPLGRHRTRCPRCGAQLKGAKK